MSAPAELRQLADRLDHHAEPFEDTANKLGGLGQGHANAAADLRAAAVALRHHANLIDAVEAHRRDFRESHYTGSTSWECDEVLWAALDATAVSPPPAPTTCPTCGSDDPASDGDRWIFTGRMGEFCPDSWHQAAT
jgi:hypothetical protein